MLEHKQRRTRIKRSKSLIDDGILSKLKLSNKKQLEKPSPKKQ